MRKIFAFLLSLALVGLVVGLLLTYAALLIAGWFIWIITWRYMSGFFEQTYIEDYGTYEKKYLRSVEDLRVTEELASRRRGSALAAIFFFAIGGLYMIVGILGVFMYG
jgi:hypothetical protein